MEPIRIIISVTNDLVTDQRVHRHAMALHEKGVKVILVGRKLGNSLPLLDRPYATHRLHLIFNKGPLFYAEINIRLFFFILFKKCDWLLANDLDTLMPNYIASRLLSRRLIYDSHEYYTGVPELDGRLVVRGVWRAIERWILPKLETTFTVNHSIAKLYKQEYGVSMGVVRNIPDAKEPVQFKTRADLGWPVDSRVILFQGSGINVDRGGEEALQAMQYVKGAVLYFIGGGDVIGKLKQMSQSLKLETKVRFIDRVPPDQLFQYTLNADLGLSLDKGTNINYRYSLPNKLFDYIHAGVPVLVSDLPEVAAIVREYNVGLVSDSHEPEALGKLITEMLNSDKRAQWHENLKRAALQLNWAIEKQKLLNIFGLS